MHVWMEKEAESFLEKRGFPVAQRGFVTTKKDALALCQKIGYPVVLKVVGVLHKSDVGGVIIDVRTKEEAEKGVEQILSIRGCKGIAVHHYTEGLQLFLGLKKDATFGHVVGFGAGGIYTEFFKDVSFRACPITEHDAMEMMNETNIFHILAGARGLTYSVSGVKEVLMKLSHLAYTHKDILELDINPLIVNSKETLVADCRIVFA